MYFLRVITNFCYKFLEQCLVPSEHYINVTYNYCLLKKITSLNLFLCL